MGDMLLISAMQPLQVAYFPFRRCEESFKVHPYAKKDAVLDLPTDSVSGGRKCSQPRMGSGRKLAHIKITLSRPRDSTLQSTKQLIRPSHVAPLPDSDALLRYALPAPAP